MCGIAGIVRARERAPVEDVLAVRAMGAWQVHRGPDAWGEHVGAELVLGHNRLAIVDLADGKQPMSSKDGNVWVVFNGEIYNHQTLRAELQSKGHAFQTDHSDTEVLVVGYQAWGTELFARLEGMFALAIWDQSLRELVLARDRAGIKPLTYCVVGDTLVFASELKALLASGLLARDFDAQLLPEFFTYRTTGENCFIPGAKRLPAGSFLRFSARTGSHGPSSYWALPQAPATPLTHAEALDHLLHVLRGAVHSHLLSDVPLGVYLSGGVDSSVVAALAAGATPLSCFTIGTHSKLSEVQHARVVASALNLPLYERVVEPQEFVNNFDHWAYYNDDPVSDPSALALMLLTQHAREAGMKVMLSGEGADELFGGYNAYLRFKLVSVLHRSLPYDLRRGLGKRLAGRWQDYLSSSPQLRYLGSGHLASVLVKSELLLSEISGNARDQFERLSAPIDPTQPNLVRQAMRFDQRVRLPYDVLARTDRATMAFSVEGRVPFLDRAVLEWADTLPDAECIDMTRLAGKPLLKELAASLVPRKAVYRRKRGFDLPVGQWIASSFNELARSFLSERRVQGLNYAGIAHLYGQHASGRQDRAACLWAWLVIERWYRLWVQGEAQRQAARVPVGASVQALLQSQTDVASKRALASSLSAPRA